MCVKNAGAVMSHKDKREIFGGRGDNAPLMCV